MRRALLALVLGTALLAVLAPAWLPVVGTALVVEDAVAPADAALVLDGGGRDMLDAVEGWRRAGLVREVVVVEAPVKTHALVAYWTDFVGWGLAPPPPIPADHLHVVRSPSGLAGEQARAALPTLIELGAQSVLVPGGWLGSRLGQREVTSVLRPAAISVRMLRPGPPPRPPERWYQDAEDRRAVLDALFQLAFPFVSGYSPEDT